MATASELPFCAPSASASLLATHEQLQAERALLLYLADPKLKAIQSQLRAELVSSAIAGTVDGESRLDEAIAQWTNSLIFTELAQHRSTPTVLWWNDDTPHSWFGHTVGGSAISGDNPDVIYRFAVIDGCGSYEISGRFDMARRPAQFIFEVDRGSQTKPGQMFLSTGKHTNISSTVALITDRDLAIAPDGSFRISLGGVDRQGNHFPLPPGIFTIVFRDVLSNWHQQQPCKLTVRRLDTAKSETFDPGALQDLIYADLPDYVRFWAGFPQKFCGGLKPNTISSPNDRTSGWGLMVGLRYQLAPDEAVLVTTTQGDAHYTGFQVVDPWMVAPDARRHQASLNTSQAVPNTDGSFTYVIAAADPGVANWLDTAGLSEGFGIIRWQAMPEGMITNGLIREFRVISHHDIAAREDLIRVSPQQRKARLDMRAQDYLAARYPSILED